MKPIAGLLFLAITSTSKGEGTMRHATSLMVICAVVILLQPRTTLAYHDLTCHPAPPPSGTSSLRWKFGSDLPGPSEELNLIVPGVGGATSASCSDADGNPIAFVLPPDSSSAVEHVPGAGQPSRYWYFERVSEAFLDARVGLSAELPNFTKSDGTLLLTQYNETGLDFLLQAARDFDTGESLSASGGQILAWPAVTLREMPAAFGLDELFPPDPARFPLYSGTALVADVAIYAVVPEPASWLLLLGGAMAMAGRRRILGRS